MSKDSLRVTIIIGQDGVGTTAAAWFAGQAGQRDDIEVDVIDLAEAWLPEALPVIGGRVPQAVQDLAPWLAEADAFVIVTPNRSFPASLKNAIDWYRDEWKAKPVAFVSYGDETGGLRAVEQLRLVFADLQAMTVRDTVIFHDHRGCFTEAGRPLDPERCNAAARNLLDQLVWWARALKSARTQKEEIMSVNREIHLVSRPAGEPALSDFKLVETAIPEPGEGQVLVRNTWLSVDPYMRGRMDDVESYIPPFPLGAALDGSAVGEVVESGSADIPVGATVVHFLGWREYAVVDAAAATVIDPTLVPAQAFLGALGTTGLTAYTALTEVAPVKEGDVVFISGAAGAVGSIAGQIARKLGASRVIGSAGGPEKGKRLIADFGYDAAIDYKAGSLPAQLAEAAPEGIDVYLDNVGGSHLEAAIGAARPGGRIALVGAISGYNEPVPGPGNLFQAYAKELNLRGMLITSYLHLFGEYIPQAIGWLADGSLYTEETVIEGIDQAPAAFLALLRGANTGKMLVRLA
jgi:NADPH-dependent curcumin reductase CurA/NAD(P)H-dependent FMN reductase